MDLEFDVWGSGRGGVQGVGIRDFMVSCLGI